MPAKAAMQLNTRATMPRAVNPAGSGAMLRFSPVRSSALIVLAAAFPTVGVGVAAAAHAS
jgi:hypothetical protein